MMVRQIEISLGIRYYHGNRSDDIVKMFMISF